TSSAASIRIANFSRTTGCFTTSVNVVIAPISRPPLASLIPCSSLTCVRSTTTFGFFSRSFSQSMLSRPPASTHASVPYRSSSLSASSTLAGWYSSNTGITSRITAIVASPISPSNVGGQRFMCPRPVVLERVQQDVGRHGRAPERFVANRIQDRVHDRAVGRAHRRLADAANSGRRFRIGNVHGIAEEIRRRVENRRRLVLVEAARERDAVV